MLLIIQILIYLVLLLSNIIHDAILINYYKRSPKHSKNVYVIGFIAVSVMVWCMWLSGWQWQSLIYLIPALSYLPTRWLIHDPLVNLSTGKDAAYIGNPSDDEEDAKLDNFLYIDPPKQYYFKALLLIVVLVASIILYNILN